MTKISPHTYYALTSKKQSSTNLPVDEQTNSEAHQLYHAGEPAHHELYRQLKHIPKNKVYNLAAEYIATKDGYTFNFTSASAHLKLQQNSQITHKSLETQLKHPQGPHHNPSSTQARSKNQNPRSVHRLQQLKPSNAMNQKNNRERRDGYREKAIRGSAAAP